MSWRNRIAGQIPSLVIARRNISRAKGRSALAAVAILIGVVAIGTIGAGGAAFKESQYQRISDQGATNVFVMPGFDKEQQYFDPEDLKAIKGTVSSSGVVATSSETMEWVKRAGRRESVSVTYMDDPAALYTVETGTIPANWRQSVVVSQEFAQEHGTSVGDRLTLVTTAEQPSEVVETRSTYRVVAVLAETQGFGSSQLYLPIEQASDRHYSQVRITTDSVERAERAATAVRDRFNGRKDRVLVFEFSSLVRLLKAIITGINAFLAGLGSISLLVAGVSITNTMLMAVIRRREEIGVLRAVGYTKSEITRILLVEAVLLGVIGSSLGLVIAVLLTLVANAVFLGDPFAFSHTAVLYLVGAVGFGILTSLVAGVYPAWRAANERPVDALRG